MRCNKDRFSDSYLYLSFCERNWIILNGSRPAMIQWNRVSSIKRLLNMIKIILTREQRLDYKNNAPDFDQVHCFLYGIRAAMGLK